MPSAVNSTRVLHIPLVDDQCRSLRHCNRLMAVALSRYIIRNKAGYYNALLAVTTRGAWGHATEETAIWTLAKIEALRRLLEHTADFARKMAP